MIRFVSIQTSLESITESLRSLSVSINNNGCLYRSETKFYVGIPIALAEFQLQAFPKSQLVGAFILQVEIEVSKEKDVLVCVV